jgi:hypothetical protein
VSDAPYARPAVQEDFSSSESEIMPGLEACSGPSCVRLRRCCQCARVDGCDCRQTPPCLPGCTCDTSDPAGPCSPCAPGCDCDGIHPSDDDDDEANLPDIIEGILPAPADNDAKMDMVYPAAVPWRAHPGFDDADNLVRPHYLL